MPEGREGKLAEPFYFALRLGRSLRLAAAFLVYACKLCREDERTERFFIRRRISVFPDRGVVFLGDLYNRRRRFWWIHSFGREGKRAAPFSFALPPLNFHGTGGQAGAGFGGSLPSAAALLVNTCKLRREDERTEFIFIRLRISAFSDQGVEFRGIYTIGGSTIGFKPLGREGNCTAPFPFALPPLNFHGPGERGGAGFGGSLPSAAVLLVYACQRVGRASVLNVYF